jgi:hypothetical protein
MTAQIIAYQLHARRAIALASLVCLMSVLCYGAFLLMTVEKAALQQKYESDARHIGASLADLESHYLEQSATLTPLRAHDLGLVPVASKNIAYEQVAAPTLSLRQ